MDVESYGAWERRGIALLTRGSATPREALAELESVTRAIAAWTPGSGALLEHVESSFRLKAEEDAVWLPASSETGDRTSRAITRWLAARLFGAWTAYQGDGLAVTLRFLDRCLGIFESELASDGNPLEAIRRSDLRVVHTDEARSLKR
jgi:hypothetical protein